MYNGDRARKQSLVEFGFRLPSAFDNRPLKFEEIYKKIHQVIYVSATPGPWEIHEADGEIVQQIIRPTGLLDPDNRNKARAEPSRRLSRSRSASRRKKEGESSSQRSLKSSQKISSKYSGDIGVKAKYLHSDIDTLERVQIINELRKGISMCSSGSTFSAKGSIFPKYLSSPFSMQTKRAFCAAKPLLIQTCGRAARNVNGRVIMYADRETKSIAATLAITARRRILQQEFNTLHNITPTSTKRVLLEQLSETFGEKLPEKKKETLLTKKQLDEKIHSRSGDAHSG